MQTETKLWLKLSHEFYDGLRTLDMRARAEVNERAKQALGYAWGWQDACGYADHDEALAFGYAYGIAAADFHAGIYCMLPAVQDCFRRFQDGSTDFRK